MKWLVLTGLLVIAAACSKDKDPGFTSAEGKWKYTTADGKIAVTFELVKSGSGLDLTNQTIKVDGALYNAEKVIDGVNLPTIGTIRINANDAKAVYPYRIEFKNGVVSTDFKKIEVPDGTYTFPWPTLNTLKTVVIERQ